MVVMSEYPLSSAEGLPSEMHRVGDYRRKLKANPHDVAVAPSKLPRVVQQVFVAIFVALILLGLFFIIIDRWRRGTTAIGFAMVYLGAIRWVVDSDVMGIFAVRSRKLDSWFSVLVGLAMMYLAISVDTLGS